jgi:hypothetical protein
MKGTTVKRVRPPMPPLSVRVVVAERQFKKVRQPWEFNDYCAILDRCLRLGKKLSLAKRLKWLLSRIFEDVDNVVPHACDHDPALILRPYNPRIKDVAARYTPHAHDPDALIYRARDDHQLKTTGRRPGAARTITTKGSDIGLKTKFARLERGPKPKRGPKIRSPGFRKPAGKQKWPKRGFES